MGGRVDLGTDDKQLGFADTGDEQISIMLSEQTMVITGYIEETVVKIVRIQLCHGIITVFILSIFLDVAKASFTFSNGNL